VFAEQESADHELWACADKSFGIGSIFFIEWHGYWCVQCPFPFRFEVFPPDRQFTISADVIQDHIEFAVICGC
jgi:hypothetical protein